MSNEERKDILECSKKYSTTSSKQLRIALLTSIMRPSDYYVPYFEKIQKANKIISIANKSNNITDCRYYYNSPRQYFLYTQALLEMYTLLNVTDNYMEEFDLLNKGGFLNAIIDQMPEDKKEFDVVFGMVKDDAERNDYNNLLFQCSLK